MSCATFLLQIIPGFLLMGWLITCVVYDLSSRQVPAFLTIPPLVIAAIWHGFQGGWLEVLLVVALIVISDLSERKLRFALACLACISSIIFVGSVDLIYVILAIFATWMMWEVGATGGADAKIIISLIMFFGNGLLFIPILLAGGFQGLYGLITRRKTIPYTIAIVSGTMIWFSLLLLR